MEEEVPTLTEKPASAEVSEPVAVKVPKPAAEGKRPGETGRRQTSGKRDEAVARHGGKRLQR